MSEEVAAIKEQTRKQWNTNPCGHLGEIDATPEYFEKVEQFRYQQHDWFKTFYPYNEYKDKKVLEVGFGQGTDGVQFAKGGADYYGVDITERHFYLANKNFENRGLNGNFYLEDASQLHFEDNYFDLVYSCGVLHHTPDIEDCVKQVHRVLKPGGQFIITLYHKNSWHYYWKKLLIDGIFRMKLLKIGHDGLLSTIEHGADGKDIKPYVKLYSTKDMQELLSGFSNVDIHIRHMIRPDIPGIHKLFSDKQLEKYSRKYGWYIVGWATK